MKSIHENINNNGVGIIEVPNFDMIQKKKLFTEFIRDHIYYFSKKTLKNALSINGFDVLSIKTVWHDYISSATIKKRKRVPLKKFLAEELILNKKLDYFFKINNDKKIAIWGAGHQALTTISLTNISDKISFIIDSSKHKQNKFAPSSHLYIFPPEILNESDIDGIIVICGSFSNEVVKLIKSKYKKIKNVYVFNSNKILRV